MTVMSVAPLMDVVSGRGQTQVIFGEQVALTEPIRKRLRALSQPVQSTLIQTNTLILALEFKGVVPYRIGSKWELNVNEETGAVTLKEANE